MRRFWHGCRTTAVLCMVCLSTGLAGCGAKLRLAPVPRETVQADQTRTRAFDFGGDGKIEYRQILDTTGQVCRHEFDRDGDAVFEEAVDRDNLDPNTTRHVFLLLDGVPYSLMEEMWRDGYFRLFSRPGQLVSTFPSVTDPAYCQLFHCGPPMAYEAEYFDRKARCQLGGARLYLSGKNEPWARAVDHRLNFIEDAVMYLFPGGVFKRELATCQGVLDRKADDGRVVLYLLSTDAICHMFSPEEAKARLVLLDRWINQMVYEAGGRVHLTMLADHGNNFCSPHFVDFHKVLKAAGLRVSKRLRKPGDVVAPRFGLINFASFACYGQEETQKAADTLIAQEGVEVVAWRDGQVVRVGNSQGRAVIRRREASGKLSYSYEPVDGDPLMLAETVSQMLAAGLVDGEGFAMADVWFAATKASRWPDAVPRLYEGLHGIVQNPADIVVSLANGYYCGDPGLTKWVTMVGTHGGLGRASTVSFLMSSAFVSPEYVRMAEVLPLVNQYMTWTPRLDWVDYTWLVGVRAMPGPATQGGGAVR